jgi:histidinol-phosphatase (PHP family)
MIKMLEEHTMDILAHFDLVKRHNRSGRFFDERESWYRDLVTGSLDLVKQKGVILEANTGGWARGKTDTLYPSLWILKEAYRKGIPVVLSADAHIPDNVGAFFREARELLNEAGYTSRMILKNGGWKETPI